MAVTLRDISEKSGFSKYTVSRVLSGKAAESRIPEATAKKVLAVAAKMGYRPSASARAVAAGKTGLAGVVVSNSSAEPHVNMAAFEIIVGLNIALQEAEKLLVLIDVQDVENRSAPSSRVFRERTLDAVAVLGPVESEIAKASAELAEKCVWIDSHIWRKKNSIRRDDAEAGQECASILVESGCERLVWFNLRVPGTPHYSYTERQKAAKRVAKANKIPFITPPLPDSGEKEFIKKLPELLCGKTGVVAHNAVGAQWISHAANQFGLIAGRDFALCCCESSHAIDAQWPTLSRISYNRHALGLTAGKHLAALMQDEADFTSFKVSGERISGTTSRFG